MKKIKVFSLLTAVVLLFGVLCVCAAAETNETTLSGQQLSLGDDLDMKFYVAADADTAVHVSVDGKTTAYDLRGKAPVADGEGKGTYEIVVSLSAAQMTSRITLNFKQGGEDVQISSSVREYADRILEGEYSDSTKTLVRAMLNYGAATQMYFYHNPYDLATKGLDMTDVEEVAVPDQNYATILHAPEGVDGITFHGASLVLKSQTTLRCYFKLDAGKNISAYDFEGKQVQSIASNGETLYYIDITDIAPHQLDAAYTVYINGQAFVSYNPMAYIQRVYHKDTTADLLKKLMKALYGYYEAAIAYVHEDNATVTLPTATGGTITADKNSYKLGDTVTLTVTPDAGYSQKLFINGQPLLLDWKTNTYRFVAEENIYNITGGFVPSLPATPRDASRWDTANQAHGVLNAYYPSKTDAWLVDIGGEYSTVSTKAKNYLAGEDGTGGEEFAVVMGFKLSNGKEYTFRVVRQGGKYYCQRFGINGKDWTKKELDAAAIAAVCGNGVDFKVERTAANKLTVSVNGVVYDTYTMDGVTEEHKVTLAIIGHYGNKGSYVAIPYELQKQEGAFTPISTITVPTLENGTVEANKKVCEVGDTVTLTVTPDAGYSQKLYINDEPLLLDWKTNTYSFVVTEKVYNITGSFEPSLIVTPKDAKRWDAANQAHGILNAYYPNNDDAWLTYIAGEYNAVSTKVRNYLAGEDGTGGEEFAVVTGFKLSDGKEYTFRVVRQGGKYYCQRFGINGSDWTKKELDAAAIAAICGDGADFKVERTAADKLSISVNGVVYDTYTMAAATEDTYVTSAVFGHYRNRGLKVALPFTLTRPAASDDIQFRSGDLSRYTIVYAGGNDDYAKYAQQLKTQILEKYGQDLPVVADSDSNRTGYEILLGDTNRFAHRGCIMEYSVSVSEGVFRINAGGSCSAENAIAYLCENVFNGQEVSLAVGEHFKNTLLTKSRAVTSGTTARVMTANLLADAFVEEGTYNTANYRAEIFAGMLVAYTPDVIGMQEVDASWYRVLDAYLAKIENLYGISYAKYWNTYEGKTNYTSMLYRSDKLKVENGGVDVFSWWKDLGANYRYHMRNMGWAQFSSLEDSSKKFVVANTHWSYRLEHAEGDTYLTGASKPIAADELRTQCKNETNHFLTSLKKTYSDCPIFLTGDFNTSLPYFTQYGWTPTSFNVLSEQAASSGKAQSTVPTSGHFDHMFGTGSYTINCFELLKDANQHSLLTDHAFVYADLAF